MITRDPGAAAGQEHDLIVVGGGIYGACVALEAARRGLRPLLLERGDFGEATSWNSLRILHGGFRYLPKGQLHRFRQSVQERRWFCRTFPQLVRPLECLMPLYGEGLKRPLVFGPALWLNDRLSGHRNDGVRLDCQLPRGRVLSAREVIRRVPSVPPAGLTGAGVWYDAAMINSQRILLEILRWACSLGATALNYVEAVALERHGRKVTGVRARDGLDGTERIFTSKAVCNCAGPWSATVAARFDKPLPDLFRPSLAFNLLLDCDPPASAAVAVAPRYSGRITGPVYFLSPGFGRLLAGTAHLPWNRGGNVERPAPDEGDIDRFLTDLNAAIPALGLRREHVVRVFAGLLPATEHGTAKLMVRPSIWDHGRHGGPVGLVSVSGVKFTTARLVAEQTLGMLECHLGPLPSAREIGPPAPVEGLDFESPPAVPLSAAQLRTLMTIVRDEAVVTLDDLLLRRTNWSLTARDAEALRQRVAAALGWKGKRHGPREPVAVADVQPHAQEEAPAARSA